MFVCVCVCVCVCVYVILEIPSVFVRVCACVAQDRPIKLVHFGLQVRV